MSTSSQRSVLYPWLYFLANDYMMQFHAAACKITYLTAVIATVEDVKQSRKERQSWSFTVNIFVVLYCVYPLTWVVYCL